MKKSPGSFILTLVLAIYTHCTFANAHDGLDSSSETGGISQKQTPHVAVNIGVEINGLEAAAKEAALGLNLMGEALQDLADNPELTAEHKQKIQQALSHVDALGISLTLAVDQLPATIDKSVAPLVDASNELSTQIKQSIAITAIALIAILLAALAALYYFVLAPSVKSVIKTTALLGELANTLKTTAEIVEISSERNLQVVQEMRRLCDQT